MPDNASKTQRASSDKKKKEVNHNDMINRDMPNQHPIEAITGWDEYTEEELKTLFETAEPFKRPD